MWLSRLRQRYVHIMDKYGSPPAYISLHNHCGVKISKKKNLAIRKSLFIHGGLNQCGLDFVNNTNFSQNKIQKFNLNAKIKQHK